MTTQLDMFGKSYTGGMQTDLFVKPAAPTVPAPPALCRECGDPLPARAKVCPNCYTPRPKA